MNQLHEVAGYLIEHEKMEGDEFARLMERTGPRCRRLWNK